MFVGEECLTVRSEVHCFDHMSTLGFRLTVSENSLPPNQDKCIIRVKVYVGGKHNPPFRYPFNTELVSALYFITPSCRLSKPVTLEIGHCCSETQNIHLVQGQEFNRWLECMEIGVEISETHGKVELLEFSWFAVVASRFGRRRYCGAVYCRKEISLVKQNYDFVVFKNLRPLDEVNYVE